MRELRDRLLTLWREASFTKRGLLVIAPTLLVAAAAGGVTFAVASGGGSSQQVLAPTARATADSPTPGITDTATPAATATPANAGLQASSAGSSRPPSANSSAPRAVVNPNLSGPGAAHGTGYTLSIPSISVSATVNSETVGQNGQMGNPTGAYDVILYDFSAWPGLGGMPGQPGANLVFAGHVDYYRIGACQCPGPAVFWNLRNLQAGAQVTVNTPSGPINYSIQWVQWADPSADFTQFVRQTGQDSITLITCVGTFGGGEYSNRLVARGVRI